MVAAGVVAVGVVVVVVVMAVVEVGVGLAAGRTGCQTKEQN